MPKAHRPQRTAGTGPSRLPAEERRAQILDQAARVFAEKGYTGAKTRDIAAACGVSEAIVFRHFKSKAALFSAALEARLADHDVEAFLAGLDASLPMLETFKRIAAKILEIGLEDFAVHRLLLTASLAGPEEMNNLYVTWRLPFIEHLEKIIRRGVDRGELRPVDPLLTARAFVGLVMDCVLSCHLWNRMGQEQAEPGLLVKNNVPTFVLGLARAITAEPEGTE